MEETLNNDKEIVTNDLQKIESSLSLYSISNFQKKDLKRLTLCINEENGCLERMELEDIIKHESECDFGKQRCLHCSKDILKKIIKEHEIKCEFGLQYTECSECDFKGDETHCHATVKYLSQLIKKQEEKFDRKLNKYIYNFNKEKIHISEFKEKFSNLENKIQNLKKDNNNDNFNSNNNNEKEQIYNYKDKEINNIDNSNNLNKSNLKLTNNLNLDNFKDEFEKLKFKIEKELPQRIAELDVKHLEQADDISNVLL